MSGKTSHRGKGWSLCFADSCRAGNRRKETIAASGNSGRGLWPGLVQRTLCGGGGNRLERDAAEGLLILRQVLTEHIEESLGLLGAEIDSLKAADGHLIGRVLMGGAEGEKEVPYAGAYLHAVGVAFAIVGGFGDADPGLIVRL